MRPTTIHGMIPSMVPSLLIPLPLNHHKNNLAVRQERRAPERKPGASPTRSTTGPTPAVPSTAAPAVEATAPPIAALDGNLVSELSITDSFIMGVLRGWRLLQAAKLSNEEKRDILSTTRNQMDYESISSALRLLWDEQLLGPRHAHSPAAHQGYLHYQEAPGADHHGSEWQQGYSSEPWWPGEDWYQQWYAGDAFVWEDDATPPEEPDVPDTGDDDHLQEAQQAERVAEQLAQEAQRTWVQAKQATAALHRDRGFGKGKSPIKCFNCGGNHMARDCPDRRHPAHPKGAGGKGNSSFMAEMDPYYDIYYYDHDAMYFKGKGKNWSSGKGTSAPPRSFVNSYTTEYFGLDMSTKSSKECHSTSLASTQSDFEGMVDCGATASAGPELAVQGLIKAVVAQDHSAVIEVDQSARPYFRYGNGKWGRALHQVNISSAVSGETLCPTQSTRTTCSWFSTIYVGPHPRWNGSFGSTWGIYDD